MTAATTSASGILLMSAMAVRSGVTTSSTVSAAWMAAQWMGKQESQTLHWWLRWLRDLVSWQIGGRRPTEASVVDKLQKISESVDSRQICSLADAVTRALNSIGSGLNRQLILEDLLISWAGMGPTGRNGNRAGNG